MDVGTKHKHERHQGPRQLDTTCSLDNPATSPNEMVTHSKIPRLFAGNAPRCQTHTQVSTSSSNIAPNTKHEEAPRHQGSKAPMRQGTNASRHQEIAPTYHGTKAPRPQRAQHHVTKLESTVLLLLVFFWWGGGAQRRAIQPRQQPSKRASTTHQYIKAPSTKHTCPPPPLTSLTRPRTEARPHEAARP